MIYHQNPDKQVWTLQGVENGKHGTHKSVEMTEKRFVIKKRAGAAANWPVKAQDALILIAGDTVI